MNFAYNIQVVACLEVELVDYFCEVTNIGEALHMHELFAFTLNQHPAQRVRQQRLHRVVHMHQQMGGLLERDRERDQALQVLIEQHSRPAEARLVQTHLDVAEKHSQVCL